MTEGGDYIKDVEKYFISLAGEGIMLSSADYALILDYRKREIPKEVVLRGINRAFTEARAKDDKERMRIRSLKQCSSYIENSVIEYSPVKERKISEDKDGSRTGIIGETAAKLSEFIKGEEKGNVRDYYIGLRQRVLELDNASEENALGRISKLEGECMEEFFNALPGDERESLSREAASKIQGRGRYMTDQALGESVISFRNEIIHNRYGVRYLFGYDQG